MVTSDTSSVLDAKPSHGRQKRRRSASQMPSAASAALNVTQKPQTNTGICGYWISLYVGVISSSVTANQAHARDQPLAFDASGCQCGIGTLPELVHAYRAFVVVRLAPTMSKQRRRFQSDRRGMSARGDTCALANADSVGNVYGFVS